MPIENRTTPELIKGFKHCHEYLKKHRFCAKLLRCDNKVSKELITHIEAEQLMYQLASPGDHQTNPAERAIETFKNHFITIISGTDPDFPLNCWDLLVPQAVITMNLLPPSWINPAISTYTQISGNCNFNDTPLALTGCKVVIHNRATERSFWADHGTQGFYIGPANHHCRNYQCYIPGTKSIYISNTAEFFPHHTPLPATSSSDKIVLVLQDFLGLLQHQSPPTPFPNYGTDLHQCIRHLDTHLSPTATKSKPANSMASPLSITTPRVLHSNSQR